MRALDRAPQGHALRVPAATLTCAAGTHTQSRRLRGECRSCPTTENGAVPCSSRYSPNRVGGAILAFRRLCIAQISILVQTHRMEYRGIRYTIRLGIERGKWSVGIHPADADVAKKALTGTRQQAELQAQFMIDQWLERHPPKKP